MKTRVLLFLAGVAISASTVMSWAQTPPAQPGNRYGDRYGRYGRPGTPGMPGAPMVPTQPVPPAQPAQPAPVPADAIPFSAVPVNTNFFFIVDTNRANLWVKISATSASNTVNSRVAKPPPGVLVTTAGISERPPAESAPAESAPKEGNPKDRYSRGKLPRPPTESAPK